MNHKMILMASMLLMVLVLPSVNAQSFPSWIQDMAGWYSDGSIDDAEYIKSLQFLIDEKIIKIPQEIVYVEVLQQVQAEPLPDTHNEIWKAIGNITDEFGAWQIAFHNDNNPLLEEIDNIRAELQEVDFRHGDMILELHKDPVNQDPSVNWEKKYNELWELYDDLSLRVVDLERKEIERHDREVRTGEVQS